jgi:chorismate synthase
VGPPEARKIRCRHLATWRSDFGAGNSRPSGCEAMARQVIEHCAGIEVPRRVDRVRDVCAECLSTDVTNAAVESTLVPCPNTMAAQQMDALVREVRKDGDSVGGLARLCLWRALGPEAFEPEPIILLASNRGFSIGSLLLITVAFKPVATVFVGTRDG